MHIILLSCILYMHIVPYCNLWVCVPDNIGCLLYSTELYCTQFSISGLFHSPDMAQSILVRKNEGWLYILKGCHGSARQNPLAILPGTSLLGGSRMVDRRNSWCCLSPSLSHHNISGRWLTLLPLPSLTDWDGGEAGSAAHNIGRHEEQYWQETRSMSGDTKCSYDECQ